MDVFLDPAEDADMTEPFEVDGRSLSSSSTATASSAGFSRVYVSVVHSEILTGFDGVSTSSDEALGVGDGESSTTSIASETQALNYHHQ